VTIWINRLLRTVEEREVRRVYRNEIGDWCADVATPGRWTHNAVFDHHPSVTLLRLLRNSGTHIADDIIAQGAEGLDILGQRGGDP
jgi:hypothetical protein